MNDLPALQPDGLVSAPFDPKDQTPVLAEPERFTFTASGSEYFRIWIVNLFLSVITLGIYSAWAKVRRTRYFYGCTRLAGASFDYHGEPIAILKGRIVAAVLLGSYFLLDAVSKPTSIAMGLALAGLFPWLMWKSLKFRLYNSSYRGIRFGFRGRASQAYMTFLVMPLLSVVTFYILAPLTHHRIKKFQHTESRFGPTHFSFHTEARSFYKAYMIGLAIVASGLIVLALLAAAGIAIAIAVKNTSSLGFWALLNGWTVFFLMLMVVLMYGWAITIFQVFLSMIQNLIWNNTRLGEHRFRCEMKWLKVISIAITNLIGIIFTFGLFIPFAQVRSMRYRLESMSMIPSGSLDEFVADAQDNASATGEGVADFLDFDLSL